MRSLSDNIVLKASAAAMAATLLCAAPAAAQASHGNTQVVFVAGTAEQMPATPATRSRDAETELYALSEQMNDPATQDSVAAMAESVAEMMMRLPVGKFAAAIETARPGTVKGDFNEDATLADFAGKDTKTLPRSFGEKSRLAMSLFGDFTEIFAQMTPEFKKLGRDLEEHTQEIKARRR